MKSEKKRRQRERKRLEKFRKTLNVPEFFMEWVSNLSTEDQVRELEIARINMARIKGNK